MNWKPNIAKYQQSFVENNNPVCEICGKTAFGDYHDGDWNLWVVCKECFDKKFE